MKSLKMYKDAQMKNSEFAEEYESIQPEMDVIRAIVEARTSKNLTQKQLSERTDGYGTQNRICAEKEIVK